MFILYEGEKRKRKFNVRRSLPFAFHFPYINLITFEYTYISVDKDMDNEK